MWHDAIDCAPRFIFDVQLKDGSVVEAHHIMGNFETLDGQVLYPEKFRFKECRVVVPVSGLPRNLTKHAPDGAVCTCAEFVQSVFDPRRCAVCRKPAPPVM